MSRLAATNSRIVLIFSRMTHHLCGNAATTPKCAAKVFTSLAMFFGDLVSGSNILAGTAECIQGPYRKDEITSKTQDRHVQRSCFHCVRQCGQFQGRRVDKEGGHQHDNHHKGTARAIEATRLSTPR